MIHHISGRALETFRFQTRVASRGRQSATSGSARTAPLGSNSPRHRTAVLDSTPCLCCGTRPAGQCARSLCARPKNRYGRSGCSGCSRRRMSFGNRAWRKVPTSPRPRGANRRHCRQGWPLGTLSMRRVCSIKCGDVMNHETDGYSSVGRSGRIHDPPHAARPRELNRSEPWGWGQRRSRWAGHSGPAWAAEVVRRHPAPHDLRSFAWCCLLVEVAPVHRTRRRAEVARGDARSAPCYLRGPSRPLRLGQSERALVHC